MAESIKVSAVLPASPQRIYKAWLNAKEHGAMTGGKATCDPVRGGKFTAWDGYIEGTTLEMMPDKGIVQSWRSSEFPEGSPDSRLEILLEPQAGGKTKLSLVHTHIPDGQGQSYKEGWKEHYFTPMKKHFSKAK